MDSQTDNSELTLLEFVDVKRKINDSYAGLEELTKEFQRFKKEIIRHSRLTDIHPQESELEEIDSSVKKIDGIKNIISRDCVKVAFFGSTSNGKSTAINAMLNEDILPRGVGHTTNCFVQIEGSDDNKPYLTLEKSKEGRNIESIDELASALSDTHLKEDELVRVSWPSEKCELLKCNVVIIDSPGVGADVNIDTSIDNYCLDADIFVFVVNAESTLTNAEKNFFKKICKKLTKPNIFVLFNKWDNCASESDSQKVQVQHKTKCIEFLTNELQVYTSSDADERIFFISAKEALLARLNCKDKVYSNQGFDIRYSTFQDFEKKFHESISRSLVKTMFGMRYDEGNTILKKIKNDLSHILKRVTKLNASRLDEKENLEKSLNEISKQFEMINEKMNYNIYYFMGEVNDKIRNYLKKALQTIFEDKQKFQSPTNLNNLSFYERTLKIDIETKISESMMPEIMSLNSRMRYFRSEIEDTYNNLLGKEKRDRVILDNFENFQRYIWDCEDLFEDFDNQNIVKTLRPIGSVLSLAGLFMGSSMGRLLSMAAIGAGTSMAFDAIEEMSITNDYVNYAQQKLLSTVAERSSNYSGIVKRDFFATLKKCQLKVQEIINDMDLKLKILNDDIAVLDTMETKLKELEDKAKSLENDFDVNKIYSRSDLPISGQQGKFPV